MSGITKFLESIDALNVDWGGVKDIAVAVSGGPDSIAISHAVADWAKARGIRVHGLIVDHGLRDESAEEAAGVANQIEGWCQPQVLKWGAPSAARIQEEARKARYALMAEYCRERGIQHLFLGHHMDDQAETVLFRLAKGSGLDGLTGMRKVQNYDDHIVLVRPFLEFSKSDLVQYCEGAGLNFVDDPSNENEVFARVRLRKSFEVLEEEGLTAKRLAVTAMRLQRAHKALEVEAENLFQSSGLNKNTKQIVFKLKKLLSAPDEIVFRCILRGYRSLMPDQDYLPRMEKLEDILDDLISLRMRGGAFRKRTLGGVVFEADMKDETFTLMLEKSG